MLRFLPFLFFFFSCLSLQGQTWQGSISSDWNTPGNWSTGVVPAGGANVVINNAAAPNQPVLDANRSIGNLTLSAGSLDLDGFRLTTSSSALSGGQIANGELHANEFNQLQNTILQDMTLRKAGGGDNDVDGGNTFNGTTLIIHDDNSRWRFARTNGDAFNGPTTLEKTGTGEWDIAYRGSSSFAQGLTINTNSTGVFSFGEDGGTTTLTTGAVQTSGFTNADLYLHNLSQQQAVANGSFSPRNFQSNNSSLLGDISVNTTQDIRLNGVSFLGNNSLLSGRNLDLANANQLSTAATQTILAKNGGADDTWDGGNTFGNLILTLNDNNRIRMAITNGDTFLGTSVFNKIANGNLEIAYRGTNTFASSITINSNATGLVSFGDAGGSIDLQTGGLLTTGFTQADLVMENFTQQQTTANGNFEPRNFSAQNTSLQGDFSVVTSSQDIILDNSDFTANATFISARNIDLRNGCSFATASGLAELRKNGGGDEAWDSGNTFGPVTVILDDNSQLRLSRQAGVGDTYLSSSHFIKLGTGAFEIAFRGTNTFGGTITVDAAVTGEMSFGEAGGTSDLQVGSFQTNGFTLADLRVNNLTQQQAVANGNFEPRNFSAQNTSFQGDFSVVTSSQDITLDNSDFTANATFIAARNIDLRNGCTFSTASGTAELRKNGGGNEVWDSGNTFGPVTVILDDNSQLRLSRQAGVGDTYLSSSHFIKLGTGAFEIAFRGTNTFGGTITVDASATGKVSFGEAGGTCDLQAGGFQTNGFTLADLRIDNLTQQQIVPNGSFEPRDFSASNSTFLGDFSVETSSQDILLNNAAFTANATFISSRNLELTGGNSLSTQSGLATLTKNGGGNNFWQGGNTFGNAIITNNDNNELRTANNNGGDVFTGNVQFVRNAAGMLRPAYRSDNFFGGNISTQGTNSRLTFGEDGGRVVIDGNSNQLFLADAAFPPIVERMLLATSGDIRLQTPVEITNNVNFNSGLVLTDATNLLLVEDNATKTGGNGTSYVDGPMRKIGNDAFEFPVGDQGFYAPLRISAPANNSHFFTAEYFSTSPQGAGYDRNSRDTVLNHVSECEYWELEPNSGASSNVSVTLSWEDPRSCDVLDLADLRVARWDGSTWQNEGNGGTSGSSVPGNGTILAGNTVSSGPLTLASTTLDNILPLELLSFTATALGTDGRLDWRLNDTEQLSHIVVEKSSNGWDWAELARLEAQPYTGAEQSYLYWDGSLQNGLHYYRLRLIEEDGTEQRSEVRSLSIGDNAELPVLLYPNPSTDWLQVSLPNGGGTIESWRIYNINGQVVRQLEGLQEQELQIDVRELPSATYWLELNFGNSVRRFPVVILEF